eukprot:357179-Chlamydomonas_euryale.AAC.10
MFSRRVVSDGAALDPAAGGPMLASAAQACSQSTALSSQDQHLPSDAGAGSLSVACTARPIGPLVLAGSVSKPRLDTSGADGAVSAHA